MNILALDQSFAGTGACLLSHGKYDVKIWSRPRGFSKMSIEAKIDYYMQELSRQIMTHDVNVLVLESPANRGSVIIQLAGLYWGLRIVAHKFCIPIISVTPLNLKEWATSICTAGDVDMVEAARAHFTLANPPVKWTKDHADALYLAEIAGYNAGEVDLTRLTLHQRKVIHIIRGEDKEADELRKEITRLADSERRRRLRGE